MVNPNKITGRLGNIMFEIAFLYAYARDNNLPLIDSGLGYYYQDPIHFAKYSDEIKNLYREGVHNQTNFVAIHVRRGDYVGHPFYVDLTKTDYYQKAMAEFPNQHFMVFSDDIEWCKQQEVFRDCIFSEGRDELEDLNKMASCIGHIIANSSFSWWGAYIAPYTQKVIYPSQWHPDGVQRTFCPNEWKAI